ncbi:unnamed protein product [Paramecium pentaurelia]|uniref:Uncharacterized protein n=1 Tax=Paramecium pentaurelia TaxID=43138 RepID=A0A8S1Y7P1_9CILI|nr:unnamed protein product [Paramecium pentaurelia]
MQVSPLIRVQTSAFTNSSALRIKKEQIQPQNQMDQISPLKSTEENEQSPSKIINIYADSAIYNNHSTFSDVKNQQSIEEDKIIKSQTYNQMSPDNAERNYCERQKIIKNQIKRTNDNVKNKQKEFYESKNTIIRSGIQKQYIDSSTTQSQLIDISRSSQNFRRKSIDQLPKTQIKQIKNKKSQLTQSFHLQFQNKKQQLLSDIAILDKEIFIEQQYIQSASTKAQQNQKLQGTKSTYNKRQSTKKNLQSNKIIQDKKSKKTINTLKNLNISQNSQISNKTSKCPIRSKSQETKEVIDTLRQSREDLNQRLQRINDKYNLILDQSNKFRTNFQQI